MRTRTLAILIFDDVEVPRDRVFVDGDVELYNNVVRTSWWPNMMQHPLVRAEVKLHFAFQRFLENQIRAAFGFRGSPIWFKVRAREK